MRLRHSRGGYTAAALKAGERDQYAVQRSYGRVVIELFFDGTHDCHWHVTREITPGDVTEERTSFSSLNEARRHFRRLVTEHP